jgi:glycine dehydrogenase
MKLNIKFTDQFSDRHIGPSSSEEKEMLKVLNVSSLDELISQTIPSIIRLKKELDLPNPISEYKFLKDFKELASKNKIFRTYIGQGYFNTITPPVILRNILENPGWYTAYTPYQAEIAQGRLEALINYQTMVCDLTGMEIANASLLDEATAAAEAMTMLFANRKGQKKKTAIVFMVSNGVHPQTIAVLKTRATPIGIAVEVVEDSQFSPKQDLFGERCFGVMLQYPQTNGTIVDYRKLVKELKEHDVFVAVAADIMSLTVLTPPGEFGADVVVGTTQRFGVPMGFGGPHAAFFATRDEFKRQIPGRIIGFSKDRLGKTALRMALQTREQHIKREKATSNICTSQVLLAVMAGMYAVYHGPEGLKAIANRIHGFTAVLANNLNKIGVEVVSKTFFDTLMIKVSDAKLLQSIAENARINFRYYDKNTISISIDETIRKDDLVAILGVFAKFLNQESDQMVVDLEYTPQLPEALLRTSEFLSHEVFNLYHSEHEMLRYMKRLENKDLSLVHGMISLGSCTMKLNATTEMIPVTWPEFGEMHPFVPENQAAGYSEMFKRLDTWLSEITGFKAVSFQPNSGAQGEYAGLLVIKQYLEAKGEAHRNIALIPASAHGTNPASAVMVGYKVVVVACDDKGNVDLDDLKVKIEENKANLACLMVTYPSTHGVFEETIIEMCHAIHQAGGQVYMDGANMNAQVGLTSPSNIGADVCHLNLHKTFCIPHGGGGPGVGPIGVAGHLVKFLPGHQAVDMNEHQGVSVSAAPRGSAGILPISYAYIAMMGQEGLKKATQTAILNANYILNQLKNDYPILYLGKEGRCAHELIVDCRGFKQFGIEVEDIAKRLMDYGFHAPTVSFPVAGTLMIEPTESESKAELDKFCRAMLSIKKEILEVVDGKADAEDNVLKNAPHTLEEIIATSWSHSYPREKAAFPMDGLLNNKSWPTVSRIDGAYGDRNLVCSCNPIEEYAE